MEDCGGRIAFGATGSSLCACRCLLFFLLCFLCSTATAQPIRQLETGFERDVNRYRWTAAAQIGMQAGAWDVLVLNRFLSDAFLLLGDRLSFRDENRLTWRASRPLTAQYTLQARGEAGVFTQSRVFSQASYAGVRYAPSPYLWVEPALGLAWDRRPGVATEAAAEAPLRMDTGPAFGARMSFAPPVEGYQVRVQADAAWQRIAPRQGHSLRLDAIGERRFEDTQVRARLRTASIRRDAYQAVSFLNRDTSQRPETIEATTSDTLDASVEIDAPFYRGLRLGGRLDFGATNRFIRTKDAPSDALFFETDFHRRAVDAEAALRYESPRLTTRFAARGQAAVERRELANREALPPTEAVQKSNLLQQADYDEGAFMLLVNLQASPQRRVVLTFDGAASIVRHDTPETNPDDRDEVFYTADFGTLLHISRYLRADVRLYGSFNHTVYINAARSAENNTQRALRLRPAVEWTPSQRTRVRLSPEVRATYTVDDFVLAGRRPTDQSAREMQIDLTGEHDGGGGLRLLADAEYSDLRLGRLLWDEFAEIPFDTLRTYSGWLRVQAQVGPRATAEVGLRTFIRSDFDRAVTVRYPRVDDAGNTLRDEDGTVLLTSVTRPGRQRIEQLGPTCAIAWTMLGGSALRLDGWVNVQHTRQRLYGGLPDASADRIRSAAHDGQRRIIPNLALTALWRF